ncbi:class Ib ribonucleoside-diphosphate reductase assembly flavoprotein NrdI, partial [Staphylococcus aureus]|uniref:class Ib ribonucleoside-diphosphate reductase assembly flavoprotein NrdI n=1 Tax=Staphylococcus aureus TaxID=1280 RepID=UPI0011A2BE7A
MKIIYFSFTPNVPPFINTTELQNTLQITPQNSIQPLHQPFIILTPTIPFPQLPQPLQSFLQLNHQYITPLPPSPNPNSPLNFPKPPPTISQHYNLPLLINFQLHPKNRHLIQF